MIKTKQFFNFLNKNKIEFFTGVPDSVLKETNNYFKTQNYTNHIITANEGSAISLGVGYNLATKKIPCVYMQNSGLGNALNPLISIAHKKVYSIPMLLLIGWRGSPRYKDEPQHEVKGMITRDLLNLIQIKYCILKNEEDFKKLKKLINYSKKNQRPVACLVEKNIFKNSIKSKKSFTNKNLSLKRADIISDLLKKINKNTKIVATTGFTSRELHQLRNDRQEKKGNDFYMVGGMGHSSMVSLGISIKTKKQVVCIDGDGSFLMHLGSLASISKFANKNFKHILFNNYSHESVGGQPTNIDKIEIKKLVLSCGYKNYYKIFRKSEVKKTLINFLNSKGPSFLEIQVKNGSINNLKRPKNLLNIKKNFMKSF